MSAPQQTRPLSQQDIARINAMTPDEIISLIGGKNCDVRVLNTVKGLDDRRIYQLMPQMVVAGQPQNLSSELDFDGQNGVSNGEIRAALILAARIARERGIELKDVPLSALNEVQGCNLTSQINGQGPQSCPVPGRN